MTRWLSRIDSIVTNCFYLVFTALIVTGIQFRCVVLIHSPFSNGVLLQHWHVENVIDPLFPRQFEFVGLFVYWAQNSKRFEELRLQLPILFGLDIFVIQPNFITRGIALRLDAFIVGPFLKFLGMVEVFFANDHQFS